MEQPWAKYKVQFKVQELHFESLKETYQNTRHQSKPVISCGDGSIDVKSTEVRTANGLEIKGFREFGVNIIGLLHALFFVPERTGLL